MTALPSVSFFVPAYNCEVTLEETVNSIFDGNFQSGDEIVIVNDGSSDGTANVIRLLADQYSAIQTIEHRFNRGGGAARNTAVENASHDMLFCLDSDNILAPNSVGRLREFLVNQSCDVAAFQDLYYFESDTSQVARKWHFKPSQTKLADYLAGTVVPGASGNYMFTRDSWFKAKGYPEFAGALDAWGFGLRQVATDQLMMVLPESHYFHRYGHESYWMREAKRGKTSLIALQLLIPFLDAMDNRDVEYVMSRRGRYSWFENLDRRPLRLASGCPGSAGVVENGGGPDSRPSFIKRSIDAVVRIVQHRSSG